MIVVAGTSGLAVLAAVAWKRMQARTGSYTPLLSMPPLSPGSATSG